MLDTVITAVIVSVVTSALTFMTQERRLRTELKTEFMAENAIRMLLESDRWEKRTFGAIQKRISAFDDAELRKLLIRAGAVRFEGESGEEFWGLISRNQADI